MPCIDRTTYVHILPKVRSLECNVNFAPLPPPINATVNFSANFYFVTFHILFSPSCGSYHANFSRVAKVGLSLIITKRCAYDKNSGNALASGTKSAEREVSFFQFISIFLQKLVPKPSLTELGFDPRRGCAKK